MVSRSDNHEVVGPYNQSSPHWTTSGRNRELTDLGSCIENTPQSPPPCRHPSLKRKKPDIPTRLHLIEKRVC